MALKGDRQFGYETARYRLNEVAEKGYFVMLDSANEGYVKVVDTDVTADIDVLGCLLHNMVADESTERPENFQRAFNVWQGGKVPVLQAGRIRTDAIHDAGSLAAAAQAFVNQSGILTDSSGTDGYAYRRVGVFESAIDSDGYVEVDFDCRK
jgi:hypothetical protein